jgi:hypothetical protein
MQMIYVFITFLTRCDVWVNFFWKYVTESHSYLLLGYISLLFSELGLYHLGWALHPSCFKYHWSLVCMWFIFYGTLCYIHPRLYQSSTVFALTDCTFLFQVCPVCTDRVGMDLIGHMTLQHPTFFKVSVLSKVVFIYSQLLPIIYIWNFL